MVLFFSFALDHGLPGASFAGRLKGSVADRRAHYLTGHQLVSRCSGDTVTRSEGMAGPRDYQGVIPFAVRLFGIILNALRATCKLL